MYTYNVKEHAIKISLLLRVNEKGAKRGRDRSLSVRVTKHFSPFHPFLLFSCAKSRAVSEERNSRGAERAKFSAGSYPLPLVALFVRASRITR